EPFGLVLGALGRAALLDVSACAVETGLFIVPEGEPDRAIGAHVGRVQHPRQLHDERRARAVVICRLAPPDAVHMRADDVHLLGVRGADLRAVHLLPRARRGGLGVERAYTRVGLLERIAVDAGPRADPAVAAAARGAARISWRRVAR